MLKTLFGVILELTLICPLLHPAFNEHVLGELSYQLWSLGSWGLCTTVSLLLCYVRSINAGSSCFFKSTDCCNRNCTCLRLFSVLLLSYERSASCCTQRSKIRFLGSSAVSDGAWGVCVHCCAKAYFCAMGAASMVRAVRCQSLCKNMRESLPYGAVLTYSTHRTFQWSQLWRTLVTRPRLTISGCACT